MLVLELNLSGAVLTCGGFVARIALVKANAKQKRKSVSAPNSDLNKVQLVPAVVACWDLWQVLH